MKIQKRQYYLRYASSPEVADNSFSLTLTEDLHALLRDWGPTTRISPVWRLTPNLANAEPGGRESGSVNILFLSGATPTWLDTHLSRDSLALLGNDSILLTLGVFSLVIISWFEEVTIELTNLFARHDIVYENWHCSEVEHGPRKSESYVGNDIERVNPVEFKAAGQRSLTAVSRSLFDQASIQADDSIGLMALELYALLAVIESRSTGKFKMLSDDCIPVEAMVAQLTSDSKAAREKFETDMADPEPQDLLLTLNAALSRLSSQAFSGTSPIQQTESHFWPHSLLGIGVANLALRNVASFIAGLVSQAKYYNAYTRLLDLPAKCDADLTGRNVDLPAYLNQRTEAVAQLPGHAETLVASAGMVEKEEPAPTPITYYSGRDGFRNDALTMSAPLPSVSGCNSHQWNLGTITHELSHRILAGKIERLFAGLLDWIDQMPEGGKENVRKAFELPPDNIRDQAERLLGFTLAVLHRKDMDDTEWAARLNSPATLFRGAKERYSVAIEETLVHIFDFYHFYGSNTKAYVDFVWLSWAVQPMIARRQDEYIKRTLTALSIKHFHAENWQELAIVEFRSTLESAPLADRLKMQPAILEELSGERQTAYFDHLRKMRPLLTLFHLAFKSDRLAGLASREAYRAPKPGGAQGKSRTRKRFNYAATQTVFLVNDPAVPETRFSNPLMFLRDYSQSHKPNAAEAAWLLHMLAFNYLPEPSDGTAP